MKRLKKVSPLLVDQSFIPQTMNLVLHLCSLLQVIHSFLLVNQSFITQKMTLVLHLRCPPSSYLLPPQPPVTVFPLLPHPGSRNPLPVLPAGVITDQSRVVPSAPYPEASDVLSYQPGVVPSAPYPSASNPLSYQSGVVPSECESSPLRPAIYDPPPPYSSHPDLNDPHLQ